MQPGAYCVLFVKVLGIVQAPQATNIGHGQADCMVLSHGSSRALNYDEFPIQNRILMRNIDSIVIA